MSSEFTADLEQIDAIIARLSALAGFIGANLDEIDTRVAALTGTSWDSTAGRAYADVHREWATSAREFVEGVRTMSDAARRAHEDLTYAVDLNRRMLDGG
ncbi:WXG100 family type VII secretion target [Nocardia sp. NPDC057353]|uniref:WXG100 family type VII secretion target n=1 Tax=Nocardia sp. NPDC057353 TaxID=3346104 RepID=UPI0036297248